MREPPELERAAIRSALREHYGVSAAALTFLPIGHDLASFAYRVEAEDGSSYFLKLRAGSGFGAASLMIPRLLREQGVPHVLAPLPTVDRGLWLELNGYALSLYPFLEARTAAEAGLSPERWQALGRTLREVHATRLPTELRPLVPQEAFVPSRRQVLRDLEPRLAAPTDPVQRDFAALWRSREAQVRALLERAEALGAELRQSALPPVLCHADLHTWNVLLDGAGQLWIVDWDEAVLAPKERDLMFVVGGIGRGLVEPDETARFLAGYGGADLDPRALAYYRCAWALQDMAAYAEEVFLMPGRREASRQDALRGFASLFAPGNIVEIAGVPG